jgi:hypothetical protein
MANPFKDTGNFNGSVGRERKVTYRASPAPDQESPQRLGDRDNLRGPGYDGTVSIKGWLRGPDATKTVRPENAQGILRSRR